MPNLNGKFFMDTKGGVYEVIEEGFELLKMRVLGVSLPHADHVRAGSEITTSRDNLKYLYGPHDVAMWVVY
jgi:hypothetical protein